MKGAGRLNVIAKRSAGRRYRLLSKSKRIVMKLRNEMCINNGSSHALRVSRAKATRNNAVYRKTAKM